MCLETSVHDDIGQELYSFLTPEYMISHEKISACIALIISRTYVTLDVGQKQNVSNDSPCSRPHPVQETRLVYGEGFPRRLWLGIHGCYVLRGGVAGRKRRKAKIFSPRISVFGVGDDRRRLRLRVGGFFDKRQRLTRMCSMCGRYKHDCG